MKIEILGQVCADRNVTERGELSFSPGSPAMFMHRVLSRFPGTEVSIAASYGAAYVGYLKAQGVDIYPPRPNIKGKTLVYESTSYPDGDRTQRAYHRGEARVVPLDLQLRARLSQADLVFFGPILPNIPPSYYEHVAGVVRRDTIKVLLPQGYFRSFNRANNVIERKFREADQILPYIDLVIVSEQDAEDMLSTAKKWAQRHRLISVVTLEERGAVGFVGSEEIELPTTPLPAEDIVDSVGSGDIFSAGLAYWLRQTGNIEEAGRRANALARKCLLYSVTDLDISITEFLAET